ncbi:hypothetical protein BCR42DRAFT_367310 [Absidia repens]|uniref:Bromo domain-containing protein n=1 Tax=Absidia repens TaxID=90262 RepID=A0A1X2IWW3_9FUNG|nr:hypothetical protein BCR42DRAFT_367310 [Absidia repens]
MSTATEWTVLERLLLSQAVNKYGEDNWPQVARTLKQHPLLQDHVQPEVFNQKNCSLQYYLMIEAMDSESAQTNNDHPTAQDMPKVERLTRQLYFQRVEELKRNINEDEERVATLLAEIDDIKSKATTTTADEQQVSPTKVGNDIKPELENGTVEQDDSKDSGDKTSKLHDTVMEDAEKTPAKNDTDMDSQQQPTPKDLSPNQNETSTDLATDDNEDATTKHNTLPATDELEDKSTTADPQQLNDTSVAKSNESNHENMDLDGVTETPAVNETSTPSSSAALDAELTSEPPLTELGIKRPPSDTASPKADMDQQTTLDSSPKRQRLDHSETPRSPSFSTPTQLMNDKMEESIIDADMTPEQADIDGKHNTIETPEIPPSEPDQSELNRLEENQSPTPASPPSSSSAATGTSAAEASIVAKTESPAVNVVADDDNTNTPGLATESGEGEEEADNLSLSLKDADGTESVAGSDSNAATPSATTTAASEKRRSVSSGNIKDDPRQKSWQKNVNLLWREIANHKNGAMFMNPIKEAQAPLYYDVVKYPLDLKAIKNRIRDGVIRTTVEFERDVVLMLTNSLMYNKEGTEIYQMAHEMLQDVTEQIKIFKTADGNSSTHIKGASILAKDRRRSAAE